MSLKSVLKTLGFTTVALGALLGLGGCSGGASEPIRAAQADKAEPKTREAAPAGGAAGTKATESGTTYSRAPETSASSTREPSPDDSGSTEPRLLLFGRATLPDGSPAAGTTVTLGRPRSSETGFEGFVAEDATVTTASADGTFRLSRTGVQERDYLMVQARRGGSASVYFPLLLRNDGAGSPRIRRKGNTTEVEKNLTLEPAAYLRGRVVDESAQPITGATVMAVQTEKGNREEKGMSFGLVTTGPDGTFALDDLSSGPYTLQAGAEGRIGADRKVNAPAADLMMSLGRGQASISGNVYSYGRREAMAGTSVTLLFMRQPGEPAGLLRPKQVTTDQLGAFHFDGLGPGKYALRAEKGEEWKLVPDEDEANGSSGYQFSLGATESTSGVSLFLYPGHTVRGLVRDKQTSQPIEGVAVTVNGQKAKAVTDAEGHFTLAHVFAPWGPNILLQTEKKGYRLMQRSNHSDPVARVRLSMGDLEPFTTIDMVRTVTVSGTVKTAEGNPVAEAKMSAFVTGDWDSRDKIVETDRNGAYEIEVKPYSTLRVKAEAEGYPVTWSPDETEVEDQSVKGVDLVLKPGTTLSGKVVDYEGKPVEGASVSAAMSVRVGRYGTGDSIGGSPQTSGPDGRFTFNNVPAVEVHVSATKKGYASSKSERSDLSGGEAKHDLTVTLLKGHFIAGKVTNTEGKPVEGVMIRLMRTVGGGTYAHTNSPETDAEGSYRVEDLEEGTYRVQVSSPMHGSGQKDGVGVDQENVDITLKKDETAGDRDRKKETRGTFVGRVVDWKSGEPIRDFTVSTGNYTAQKDPVEPGRFTIANFEKDSGVSFSIEAPGYMPLETGMIRVDSMERTFKLGPGGSVIGRILEKEGRKPLENVRVQLRGTVQEYELGDASPAQVVRTDADGRFRVEQVPPGRNWFVFRPDAPLVEVRLPTNVEHGREVDFGEILLSGGGRVKGRVVRGSTETPVAGTQVTLIETSTGGMRKDARTDAGGNFEFPGLSPASYALRVPEFTLESSFNLTEGQTQEVTLRVGDATVKGRFLRAGQGVAGTIRLTQPGGMTKTVPTDGNGSFEFKGVAAGQWAIIGYPTSGNGGSAGRVEEQVEVAENAEVTEDLLIPSGRVLGRVEDAEGQPVAGAQVSAQPPKGSSAYDSFLPQTARSTSQADGSFAIEGLKAGTYGISGNKDGRLAMANNVTVPAEGDSAPVVLRLGAGGGTIVSTALHMDTGAPVRSAWLILSNENGRFEHGKTRGADGVLTVENVPPGNYQVQVSSFGFQVSERTIEVKEGETTRIDDVLYLAGALRWSLQDKDGSPLRNVQCTLVPDDPNSIEQPRQGTVMSPDGMWVVRGLYPGSYTATATTADGKVLTTKVNIRAQNLAQVTSKVE